MKKIFAFHLLVITVILLSSCNSDPIDKNNSIFDVTPPERTAFDTWILENYVKQYNIALKYKMEDIEAANKYNLIPADKDKSIVLAQIVTRLWLEAYDEIVGTDFTKTYVPRIIHFVGSGAYNDDRTVVLGTAEGGIKVTLYNVNDLNTNPINPEKLTNDYFHTMHHEFAHILHQTKNYSADFQLISKSDYVADDWSIDANTEKIARELGFVSRYARKEANEDFVELYSFYITLPQTWWDNMLKTAGETGASIINRKIDIVRNYFNDVWGIDLDEMREIVLRRGNDIINMEFLTFEEK
jgi:substrate import-associated zinc metallohydrolase lipoprotein